jgi:hypothetical protein
MEDTFSDFWDFCFLERTTSPISSLEYYLPARIGAGGLGEGMDSVAGYPSEMGERLERGEERVCWCSERNEALDAALEESPGVLHLDEPVLVDWSSLRNLFAREL